MIVDTMSVDEMSCCHKLFALLTLFHCCHQDYMSNVHGKEIPLQYVTVKVPGQKPRGSRTVPQTNPHNSGSSDGSNQVSIF